MTRTCRTCSVEKDALAEFYQSAKQIVTECKTCFRARSGKRKDTRSKATRNQQYLKSKSLFEDGRTEGSFMQKFKRHGLTLDQYHAMAERQDFMCSLCGNEPQPQTPGKVNVDNYTIDHDHHHPKLRVRGLTCWRCNSALGCLDDDPVMARKAASYLEHHHAFRSL